LPFEFIGMRPGQHGSFVAVHPFSRVLLGGLEGVAQGQGRPGGSQEARAR
jgi:hypothetical protein